MINISIVIPLYNKASHITRALESIFSQSVPAAEVIVVDDGSTDNGAEIVKNIKRPGITLIQQSNQGVSAARNRGIQEAKSDLIAFLDADDSWKDGFLEEISCLAEKYPQAGAYGTAYERVHPTSGKRFRLEFKVLPPGQLRGLIPDYFQAAPYYPLCTSAAAVPKKILEEVGAFKVGESLAEDSDLWLRIALRYPIAWSANYLATYHLDAENRASGIKFFRQEPQISRTARSALKDGLVPIEKIPAFREYVATFQLCAANHFLILKDKAKAWEMLGYARNVPKFRWKWRKLYLMAILPGNLALQLWRLEQWLRKLLKKYG